MVSGSSALARMRCMVACAVIGTAAAAWGDLADDILALTASEHTRVVWLQGGDRLWGGGTLKGFDTQTRQTTTIRSSSYRLNRPILCTGGTRVVYTLNGTVRVIGFDGSGDRQICDGMASDVWVEPGTGTEWVIYRTGSQLEDGAYWRRPIDNPSSAVVQLCARGGGFDSVAWWQVSADGTVGIEFLPWPFFNLMRNAALDIVAGADRLTLYISPGTHAEGCWSSCAPDNSYYSFHFNKTSGGASHGALYVFKDTVPHADVTIRGLDLPSGTRTDEFYHPKFASNGARFVTLTGGYGYSGDNTVEVYFGKFNAGYNGFDGWARVTSNGSADFMPDAWIGVTTQSTSIELAPVGLAFTGSVGGQNPAAQTVTASGSAGALTGVTAQSNQSWLTVGATPSGSGAVITNQVNIAGLGAGAHNATVTVSAGNATPPTATYAVSLTVGAQVATSIALSPTDVNTHTGSQVAFSATVLDQNAQPMAAQPAITWSLSGAGDASLVGGQFTAGSVPSTYTVTAASPGLTTATSVTVYKPITITSPTAGQLYAAGGTMTISWTAAPSVAGVVMMYSPDQGENWYYVLDGYILPGSPSWGAYVWHIPGTVGDGAPVGSGTAMLRLFNYTDETMQDFSGLFSVPVGDQPPPRHSAERGVAVTLAHGLSVSIPWDTDHVAELYGAGGRLVSSKRGSGPGTVLLAGQSLPPGVYVVRVRADDGRAYIRELAVHR